MATIQRLANITPPPNRVIFFYGRGGGGHKASANAVRDCLQQDDYEPCDVKMEDIGLLLEAPILGDYVKRAFNLLGVPGGDDLCDSSMAQVTVSYSASPRLPVHTGTTSSWPRAGTALPISSPASARSAPQGTATPVNGVSPHRTPFVQGVIDKNATAIGDWLCEYFAAEQPALVVSFVPFVNKATHCPTSLPCSSGSLHDAPSQSWGVEMLGPANPPPPWPCLGDA